MIAIHRSEDRYHRKTGWLNAYWSFSFDDYHDPGRLGFGALRVWNDDTVQPGGGWGMHPHREMEIVTYVAEGQLAHRDSSGGGGIVQVGGVQRMSAGTGIVHSEWNPSETAPLRICQIWIQPDRRGLPPSYEQRQIPPEPGRGRLQPLVSGRPELVDTGIARMHQDATLYASRLAPGEGVTHALAPGRRAYLFMVQGQVEIDGHTLARGDEAQLEDATSLAIVGAGQGNARAELLLLDLP